MLNDNAYSPTSGISGPAMAGSLRDVAHGHQTLSHFEMARIERDRRDWRELAAFLNTNEPPPTNLMSIPDDELYEVNEKRSNTPLKFFRKPAKKLPPPVKRPLRLPDSAVASKTTNGHWHIAISIPISTVGAFAQEIENESNERQKLAEEQHSQSLRVVRQGLQVPNESKKVPVAKPKDCSHPTVQKGTASSDVLSSEAADVMKSYYRQERLMNEDRRPSTASLDEVLSNANPKLLPSAFQRTTFGHIFASELGRQNSQSTDPRHSGGTAYSERPLQSLGHSRGSSNASSALTIWPPQTMGNFDVVRRPSSRHTMGRGDRNSDIPSPLSVSKGRNRTSSESGVNRRRSGHKSQRSTDSTKSSVRRISEENDVESLRNSPTSPAPTRALPALPEGDDPVKQTSSTSSDKSRQGRKSSNPEIQSRQQRVKAIRMRDLSVHKEKSMRRSTLPPPALPSALPAQGHAHTNSTDGIQAHFSAIKWGKQKHTVQTSVTTISSSAYSQSPHRHLTLSPVMTVASTSPCRPDNCHTPTSSKQSLSDEFLDSLLPAYDYERLRSYRDSLKSSKSNRSNTTQRSLTPSLASSDEEGVCPPVPQTPVKSRGRQMQRRRWSATVTASSKQEDDVDELKARIRKLERDNERILKTLGAMMGMQKGVRELCDLLSPVASLDGEREERLSVLVARPRNERRASSLEAGMKPRPLFDSGRKRASY